MHVQERYGWYGESEIEQRYRIHYDVAGIEPGAKQLRAIHNQGKCACQRTAKDVTDETREMKSPG